MVAALPRNFGQEIVTVRNDITYPLYGGFISGTGARLRYKDKVLEQKGGAETFEIYQDLLRDPHVYAVMQKRYMAVIGREWYIEAGGDRRRDQKAADMVKAQLEALSTRVLTEHSRQTIVSGAGGFDVTCLGLLSAILVGFSVGEVLWSKESGEVFPQEIRIKDQRRFAFFADEKASSFALRLLTPSNNYQGEPLPNRKFITHVFHGERDNPYGLGLGGKLYWPVFFKKHDIKFWLAFCDKFGSPTAVGKYQQGNKQQRDELLKAIRAIAQEAGVTIPEGTSLEFVEADRSGATTAYKDLAEYMDHEVSKAVLGETGTTDQSDSGGSRARDEVANNIRVEIAKFDADLLCDTLNRTLIKWIVDYNFAPGSVAYPKVWRRFPELEEKEDLNSRINRDKTLQELGWRLTPDKVEEIYGDGYESLANEEEGKEPPLVSTLGVGGVQALTGFLSQVSQGGLPRENAIATLVAIFGVSQENAELMIPAQEEAEQQPGVQEQLDSIFGGDTKIQAEDEAVQIEGEIEDVTEEVQDPEPVALAEPASRACVKPSDLAKDGSKCGKRAASTGDDTKQRIEASQELFDKYQGKKLFSSDVYDSSFRLSNLKKSLESDEQFEKYFNRLANRAEDEDFYKSIGIVVDENNFDTLPKIEISKLGIDPGVLRKSILSKYLQPIDAAIQFRKDIKKDLAALNDQITAKPALNKNLNNAIISNHPDTKLWRSQVANRDLQITQRWRDVLSSIPTVSANDLDLIDRQIEFYRRRISDQDTKPIALAERKKRDISTLYVEQAVKDIQPSINKWLDTIQSTIDEIADGEGDDRTKFIALQERLYELYPQLSTAEYASVFAEAIAAAEVAGRYEVIEELPADDIEFAEGQPYLVWFEGRRTPVAVRAETREKAIALAQKRKKRGGNRVVKARLATAEEQKQAANGWVRTGPNGERPGYNKNKKGFGPPPKK